MLSYLIRHSGKAIQQVKATAEMKRGTPLDSGAFLSNKERNFDGINAVIDPLEKDCDTIKADELYNKEPTFIGEQYATDQVTATGLTKDDYLKVSGGKFVKATADAEDYTADWKYGGTYSNPFDLTMYIVEKIAPVTIAKSTT